MLKCRTIGGILVLCLLLSIFSMTAWAEDTTDPSTEATEPSAEATEPSTDATEPSTAPGSDLPPRKF